jgi:hypothetical protein
MATTADGELARRIAAVCERRLQRPSRKAAGMLALQRAVYRAAIFPRTTALATRLFRWLTRKGVVVGSSSASEFQPTMAEDFFTAMGAAQARAGARQMRKLERNLAHRRRMGRLYDDLLRQAGWPVPKLPAHLDPVLVRYPVRVADKQRAIAQARAQAVELGTWFECPLHPIETPMHLYDYRPGLCPVAEAACRQVVNLPTHPRANEAGARRGVELVRSIGPAVPGQPAGGQDEAGGGSGL